MDPDVSAPDAPVGRRSGGPKQAPLPESLPPDRQFATTLARGLEILRCFTPDQPLLRNRDIAARMKLSKPTVSRYTYTLTQLGYLRYEPASGMYGMGSTVLALGYTLLSSLTLRQLSRQAMNQLAEEVNGSVSMAIRDRLNMIYVETSRGSSARMGLSDVGMSQPIAGTAMGCAYLAGCDAAEREALLNELRVLAPESWIRHRDELRAGVAQCDRSGFCVSVNASARISAVGAPLKRRVDRAPVAFNCVLPGSIVKRDYLEKEIGPRLAAMVAGIARKYG